MSWNSNEIVPKVLVPPLTAFAMARWKQVHHHRYTPDHDDHHVNGELAMAAAWYALPPSADPSLSENMWPKDWSVPEIPFNPTIQQRKDQLAKAGALLMAEWERLDRLENEVHNLHHPSAGDAP